MPEYEASNGGDSALKRTTAAFLGADHGGGVLSNPVRKLSRFKATKRFQAVMPGGSDWSSAAGNPGGD